MESSQVVSEAIKRKLRAWEPNIGFLNWLVITLCDCELFNIITIEKAESVQDKQYKGPHLGADWYQSVSNEKAQDTIVKHSITFCTGNQRRLRISILRINLVKIIPILYLDYMQLLI